MININSTITYSPTGNRGICDRARAIDGWNFEQARHEASEPGVDISDEHLDVIQFLRNYYLENGWPKRTHELSRILDTTFRHLGGKKYLHQLFPNGPLAQGAHLSGLPAPANVVDKSFGTAC